MFDKSNNSINQLILQSDKLASELYRSGLFHQAIKQNEITNSLLNKEDPNILLNFSTIYSRLGDVDNALQHYQRYITLTNGGKKEDIRKLSQYYNNAGKIEEGFKLTINQPDYFEKHLDLGWYLYRENKWKDAFIEMDIGRIQGNILWIGNEKWNNIPLCPRWTGECLNSTQTVLVIGEGGIGDEFIFSRWINDLKSITNVHYYTNNTMQDVITRNFNISSYDRSYDYDYWVPGMSLPSLLKKFDPICQTPYINPKEEYLTKWKTLLGNDEFIVLNWKGNNSFNECHFRDIPVNLLADKFKNHKLISVCMNSNDCPNDIIDVTSDIKCWDDTLAILSLSKLNVSSCTSVAHASGSLGKLTYVYTRPDDYFTWGGTTSGEKTVWYPNVYVWRCEKMGEWEKIIDKSLMSHLLLDDGNCTDH